ncbi:MAG: DegV family protein [Lachnospiraceae bacterium]|nr:DegV family protein [Lachnospiraceae bacterium]
MAFCIITDSASDVPESTKEKYGLHVIPTPVIIDDVDYFDRETVFPEDFYRYQAEGRKISTYHVSQAMFMDCFRAYAERGDEVLYICFSTGIAGTFQAATLAKQDIVEEFPDFKITIIDSKCASIGYGLVVDKLLQMQKNGAPKELIIEAAEYFCRHMKHIVTVDSLDYLYKGGRISKTSAVMGGMLDIKPVIIVNEEGALVATEKVRGWKKVIKRMLEIVATKGADVTKQIIGIAYGASRDSIVPVEKTLIEDMHVKGILETQVGCAIGAHTGPTIIGIVYQDEINEKYDRYLD